LNESKGKEGKGGKREAAPYFLDDPLLEKKAGSDGRPISPRLFAEKKKKKEGGRSSILFLRDGQKGRRLSCAKCSPHVDHSMKRGKKEKVFGVMTVGVRSEAIASDDDTVRGEGGKKGETLVQSSSAAKI